MADGKVIIDSKLNAQGVEKGADDVVDELEKVAKKAKETGEDVDESISGSFNGFAVANALADLAVEALQSIGQAALDMAKDAVEAAAEVQASDAQFAQTFKGVEKQATKALDSIADSTGIAATRMQDSYTSIFAFTRSVGGEVDESMDIASRAMAAAADSAAYYDKSIEETTETLQSFLKGNYENDAALGIAATETTRNAKANELYAKSFQELSESQKVDVLLAMVEAGNQASGALGQAAREADSWTNVTGELEEAWKQFLAVAGQPILENLIPVVKDLTEVLGNMREAAEFDQLIDSAYDIEDAFEDVEKQYNKTAKEVQVNAALAEHYVDVLADLEANGLNTVEAQKEYAFAVQRLNELFPELNLQIDQNTGLVNLNTDAIKLSIEALKDRALYAAMEDRLTAALVAQADATMTIAELEYEHRLVTEQLAAAQANLAAVQAATEGRAISYTNAVTQASGAVEVAQSQVDNLTQLEKDLADALEVASQGLADSEGDITMWGEIIDDARGKMDDWVGSTEYSTDATETLSMTVEEATGVVAALRDEYDNAKQAAYDSITTQVGLFDDLVVESNLSAADIIANWGNQKTAFDNYAANLQKAINMGLDEALVKQLSDGSVQSMAILNEFVNGTDISVGDINTAFSGVSASKETVSAVMADITTDMSDRLVEMQQNLDTEFGDMAGIVGQEITKMQAYINSLTGKIVYVGVKTSSTGSIKPSENGGNVAMPYSLRTVAEDLPYLASGAVIPPNAPFMAVLGDQRHGTNIEAPLSTIQEAVAMTMEDISRSNAAGFEAVVGAVNQLMEAVSAIEIGDDTIGRAAARYESGVNFVHGGAYV